MPLEAQRLYFADVRDRVAGSIAIALRTYVVRTVATLTAPRITTADGSKWATFDRPALAVET